MKYIYLVFAVLLFSISVFAQSELEILWQKSYGGSDLDNPTSIQQTIDGGFIVAGFARSLDGDVLFNNGASDYWILKLNKYGDILWQKSYGGTQHDYGRYIEETADGGFILAGYSYSNDGDVSINYGNADIWILKLDSVGNILWEKSYGGSAADIPSQIRELNDGSFIIVGSTYSNDGNVSGNHGGISPGDYWVVKINSVGDLLWQKCYGGTGQEGANWIELTPDGGFIIAGSATSNNGDVTGNHGGGDFWIVKTDSVGDIQWQKSYGGSNNDVAYCIQLTSDGDYIIAGYSKSNNGDVTGNYGDSDYWIIKVNEIGNLIWEKNLGGTSSDIGISIMENTDGTYVVAGHSFQGQYNFGNVSIRYGISDFWLAKLSYSGSLLWEKTLGGTNQDELAFFQQTDDGYILTGRSMSDDIDFTNNKGWWDYSIIKLSSNFNTITGMAFIDINNNLIKDAGEVSLPNKMIMENITNKASFTDTQGIYRIIADTGIFNVLPAMVQYYNSVPASHFVNFNSFDLIDSLNNFAFQPIGTINDLQISINPISTFRPGFNAFYNIDYKNKGTTSLLSSIIFCPDTNLTFVSSIVPPTVVTSDSVIWNLPLLNPYEEGNILLTVNVSTSAILGSTVNSSAVIEPITSDTTPGDNEDFWEVTVTGSFDPNDILVNYSEIPVINLDTTELEYLIRYQNTGNDTAFTVKILNCIDENLDINSIHFMSASHPVDIIYNNHSRLFEFRFNNILLPDSNTNELLSHGFVRYRIKPKSTLIVGDLIENSASIFFDFNAPVVTNTAVTEIVPPFVPTITPSNLILCPNESDTLWTQVYDSYQWYKDGNIIPGATQQFLVVDYFNDAGYYFKVEVDSAGFFETSDSVLVDGWVFLPPFVIQSGEFTIGSTGEMIICPGDTAYLILGNPYDTNIQWTDNGVAIPGSTDDTLIVTQAGLFHVTGSPSQCPNYMQGLFDNIQVVMATSPAPTVTPNNLILCPNETDTLWTQVFSTYQWYKDGVLIPGATQQFLVVDQFNDAGSMFSVEVTQNSCAGISDSVFVDSWAFLPVFVIHEGQFVPGPTGEMLMCPGDTAYLILGLPYDTNIQWTDNGNIIPGATDDTLVVTQSGLYHVTGSPSQCPNYVQGLFDDITVIVQGPPTPVITLAGNNLTTQSGFTYQWNYNGNALIFNSNTIPSQGPGTYTVTITDANGCTAESNPFVVTSVIENSLSEIVNVNYNSATGTLHINRSNSTNETEFFVLDVIGRVVADEKMAKGISQIEIQLTGIKSGIYFVKTTDGGNTVKFLVE